MPRTALPRAASACSMPMPYRGVVISRAYVGLTVVTAIGMQDALLERVDGPGLEIVLVK